MALYSHSRISCFEQCPLKFRFSYIDKIETEVEETIEAFLGSRVHEALEKLYTCLKFQKLLSPGELSAFYRESWEKNWNDAIVIVRKEYSPENYKKMGEKFLADYYNSYNPFDQSRTIALETQRTVELGNGHFIHIRIDRLAMTNSGVYEIHDYKTSNSLPTQKELDEDRQLAIYAYGVKQMYPDAKYIKLIWHYLAFDKEMASERTAEQLSSLKQEVLKIIGHIELCKEFPAKESALCSWCEFQAICPVFKHMFKVEGLDVNEYLGEQGVSLVNQYTRLSEEIKQKEEALDKLREAMINYSKKENAEVIYGSDVKAYVRSYPKLGFPKRGDMMQRPFFDAVRKLGLWEALSIVDVYELAKMINSGKIHPELVGVLEKYIHREDSYRISIRKK